MKVLVFVKSVDGRNPEVSTAGDIVEILPIGPKNGSKVYNKCFTVVVDLDIPCNDTRANFPGCGRCENNDPNLCERIKLMRGVWSAGDIDNPPAVIKKNRYTINRGEIISLESETLLLKPEKDEADRTLLLSRALKNEQLNTIIIDKAVL